VRFRPTQHVAPSRGPSAVAELLDTGYNTTPVGDVKHCLIDSWAINPDSVVNETLAACMQSRKNIHNLEHLLQPILILFRAVTYCLFNLIKTTRYCVHFGILHRLFIQVSVDTRKTTLCEMIIITITISGYPQTKNQTGSCITTYVMAIK